MEVNSHKRTLGIIHIIYGSLVGLSFVFIGVIISAFAPFITEAIQEENGAEGALAFELVASIIRVIFTFIFIFSALPSIIGGIGLLQHKSWGLLITLIAGCISIFSFPFGTALGVYTIYVFVQDSKARKSDEN